MGIVVSAPSSLIARRIARDGDSTNRSLRPMHAGAHDLSPWTPSSIIDALPDDMVEIILDHCTGVDLARAECVCTRLLSLARCSERRWRDALARDFGQQFAPPPGFERRLPKGSMKREYVACRETLRAIVRGCSKAPDGCAPNFALGTRVYA
jgi:hypothetical protein